MGAIQGPYDQGAILLLDPIQIPWAISSRLNYYHTSSRSEPD
jgi:hypothetical protein